MESWCPVALAPVGINGKIQAIQYVREQGIPFLGLCLGMQCSVVEWARNVAHLDNADSSEFHPDTPNPVIQPAAQNSRTWWTWAAPCA
jgi:CTP synthase (UTP-ammonia lyase)